MMLFKNKIIILLSLIHTFKYNSKKAMQLKVGINKRIIIF